MGTLLSTYILSYFLPLSYKVKINMFNKLSHLVQNENCLYFLEEAVRFVFKEHKAKLNFK